MFKTKILILIFILNITNIDCDINSQYSNDDIILLFPNFKIRLITDKNDNSKIIEQQPTDYTPTIFDEGDYPVISHFPIHAKKPCIPINVLENLANIYDPLLTSTRSHNTNKNSWYFSSPNWNTNNNQNGNILREADPRSIISSHTHFLKINKPIIGNKVLFSHSKKFIGKNHDLHLHHPVHQDHFHNPVHHDHFHDDFLPHHFGQTTNLHKNTNIHIHNRNANNDKDENLKEDYVGSNLFAVPRWRRDIRSRKKRSLGDVVKVIANPKTKIDVSKTAENVGAATKNIFEKDYSPVYHMRNSLGAAQDAVYSLLNVRPHGILIPCSYKIVPTNDIQKQITSPILGDVNPAIYNMRGQDPPQPLPDDEEQLHGEDEINNNNGQQYFDYGEDPLQQIGTKLRDSVQWAHRTADHAIGALQSARQAYHTVKTNWPKLLLPYVGALETVPVKLGKQNDIVGSPKDAEFVGVGKIMDYLGMTDHKPDFNRLGAPRLVTEEEMILRKAKDLLGAPTYNHFLSEIQKHLDYMSGRDNLLGRPNLLTNAANLRAKLALDKIRHSLMLHRARENLKRLQPPKLPKLPTIPRTSLITPPKLKPPAKSPLIKKPILKASNTGLKNDKLNNPLKINSNPDLDKIRAALAAARQSQNQPPKKNKEIVGSSQTKTVNPLDKYKEKLHNKYGIKNDQSDLLGKTLEMNKNELVGQPKDSKTIQPIHDPVFTKEMKTPFMGLATKKDMEQYFKKLYCSNCKLSDII